MGAIFVPPGERLADYVYSVAPSKARRGKPLPPSVIVMVRGNVSATRLEKCAYLLSEWKIEARPICRPNHPALKEELWEFERLVLGGVFIFELVFRSARGMEKFVDAIESSLSDVFFPEEPTRDEINARLATRPKKKSKTPPPTAKPRPKMQPMVPNCQAIVAPPTRSLWELKREHDSKPVHKSSVPAQTPPPKPPTKLKAASYHSPTPSGRPSKKQRLKKARRRWK